MVLPRCTTLTKSPEHGCRRRERCAQAREVKLRELGSIESIQSDMAPKYFWVGRSAPPWVRNRNSAIQVISQVDSATCTTVAKPLKLCASRGALRSVRPLTCQMDLACKWMVLKPNNPYHKAAIIQKPPSHY